ncbi:MAG: hypothetical protein ACYS91_17425 [Planctomycetota bacterium]|jgi:hypothetical protein
MKAVNILRIYWITLMVLVLPVLNTGEAQCEITTVTYQVSFGSDDGYTSDEVQSTGKVHLRVGYWDEEPPPVTFSAMRFRNVDVPQGVLILDARLKIRGYSHGGDLLFGVIHAEDADYPAGFSGRYIKYIVKTDAEVNWDPVLYWEPADLYTSPDISAVVQEVIDRPGWRAGNAMVITYSNRKSEGNYRHFCSYEFGSLHTSGPKLEITYGEPPISDFDQDGTVGPKDLKVVTEQYLQSILYYESDSRVVIETERYFVNREGSGPAEGITWVDLTGEGSMGEGLTSPQLPDRFQHARP